MTECKWTSDCNFGDGINDWVIFVIIDIKFANSSNSNTVLSAL